MNKQAMRKPLPVFWLCPVVLCGLLTGSCQSSTAPGATNNGTAVTATPRELTPAEKQAQADVQRKAVAAAEKAKKAAVLQAKREAAEKKRQAAAAAREQKRVAREEAERQAAEARQKEIDEEALAAVRARLSREFPDSYLTQKTLLDAETEAYNYMKTVPDDNVKARLVKEFPDSYTTQKTLYESEMKAKADLGQ